MKPLRSTRRVAVQNMGPLYHRLFKEKTLVGKGRMWWSGSGSRRRDLEDIAALLVVPDDLSLIHGDDPFTQGVDDALIVSGQDNGSAQVVYLLQNLHHFVG